MAFAAGGSVAPVEGRGCCVTAINAYPPAENPNCACEGAPCDCTPWCYTVKDVPRGPVTMQMADELDTAGLWETADIARKYAIDRPRWWHRFKRSAA